jgi:hypothetical protein
MIIRIPFLTAVFGSKKVRYSEGISVLTEVFPKRRRQRKHTQAMWLTRDNFFRISTALNKLHAIFSNGTPSFSNIQNKAYDRSLTTVVASNRFGYTNSCPKLIVRFQ